ncbi:right-handed parallel beta-helix repeat-containing protein [Geoalkalibacter halelectricus]|uniref:right-handed parallel beta-helix repeat-containing protein n=1 Tax=Geoalkalibacter halelectricus TaxID=2847045 RepID=UPI003D261421
MRFFLPALLAVSLLVGACAPAVGPGRLAAQALPTDEELEALPQLMGVLSADLTVEGAVVLADDLLVPVGVTLVLRPGTTVYVVPTHSTKIEPEWLSAGTELLVRGSLRSEGTAARPVTFVPLPLAGLGDYVWAGLLLDGASESLIRHTRIEGAEQGILCVASSPEIFGNHIVGCRYGIVAQAGSNPAIRANLIEKGEAGVFCWRGSHPLIENNRIVDHNEEGVFVDQSSAPRLADNHIANNRIGLAVYPAGPRAAADQARDNEQDLRLLGVPGGRP